MAIKLLRFHNKINPPKIAEQFSEHLVQMNSPAPVCPWDVAHGAQLGLCPSFRITRFLALSPQTYILWARYRHSILPSPAKKCTKR